MPISYFRRHQSERWTVIARSAGELIFALFNTLAGFGAVFRSNRFSFYMQTIQETIYKWLSNPDFSYYVSVLNKIASFPLIYVYFTCICLHAPYLEPSSLFTMNNFQVKNKLNICTKSQYFWKQVNSVFAIHFVKYSVQNCALWSFHETVKSGYMYVFILSGAFVILKK